MVGLADDRSGGFQVGTGTTDWGFADRDHTGIEGGDVGEDHSKGQVLTDSADFVKRPGQLVQLGSTVVVQLAAQRLLVPRQKTAWNANPDAWPLRERPLATTVARRSTRRPARPARCW